MPWLSLTGYEMEPRNFSIVKSAISKSLLLDMEYTDGAGRTQRKLVAPDKIFVDEESSTLPYGLTSLPLHRLTKLST